eukprot:GHVT01009466.1.p1 GENE.GHVT01009466.1~~GHVT01009466.1.p1  ORF type:complete len:526 (+),score=131.36 GHVT01009466.1:848-2425(+)
MPGTMPGMGYGPPVVALPSPPPPPPIVGYAPYPAAYSPPPDAGLRSWMPPARFGPEDAYRQVAAEEQIKKKIVQDEWMDNKMKEDERLKRAAMVDDIRNRMAHEERVKREADEYQVRMRLDHESKLQHEMQAKQHMMIEQERMKREHDAHMMREMAMQQQAAQHYQMSREQEERQKRENEERLKRELDDKMRAIQEQQDQMKREHEERVRKEEEERRRRELEEEVAQKLKREQMEEVEKKKAIEEEIDRRVREVDEQRRSVTATLGLGPDERNRWETEPAEKPLDGSASVGGGGDMVGVAEEAVTNAARAVAQAETALTDAMRASEASGPVNLRGSSMISESAGSPFDLPPQYRSVNYGRNSAVQSMTRSSAGARRFSSGPGARSAVRHSAIRTRMSPVYSSPSACSAGAADLLNLVHPGDEQELMGRPRGRYRPSDDLDDLPPEIYAPRTVSSSASMPRTYSTARKTKTATRSSSSKASKPAAKTSKSSAKSAKKSKKSSNDSDHKGSQSKSLGRNKHAKKSKK